MSDDQVEWWRLARQRAEMSSAPTRWNVECANALKWEARQCDDIWSPPTC
ncbi:MAG: hypothetical protein AAGF32_10355 [Pseudomonadota bacterium]